MKKEGLTKLEKNFVRKFLEPSTSVRPLSLRDTYMDEQCFFLVMHRNCRRNILVPRRTQVPIFTLSSMVFCDRQRISKLSQLSIPMCGYCTPPAVPSKYLTAREHAKLKSTGRLHPQQLLGNAWKMQ